MKNTRITFLSVFAVLSFLSIAHAAQEVYNIKGFDVMNPQSVESTIQSMKNVESATVDVRTKELTVVTRTSETPSASDLQRLVKELGPISITAKRAKPAAQ